MKRGTNKTSKILVYKRRVSRLTRQLSGILHIIEKMAIVHSAQESMKLFTILCDCH